MMEALNHCQLYLRAIMISDMASANELYVLPGIKTGIPNNQQ
jgi:hypothetical protein